MKAKINRLDFFTVNDGTLVQLIGESKDADREPKGRTVLCELLNRLEFTLESYGPVNFFLQYEHEIYDLEELSELLEEFNDTETIEAIKASIRFYKTEQERFNYLRSDPSDYDSKVEELNRDFRSLVKRPDSLPFHIPLNKSLRKIASHIRQFPDEYCTDENGQPIDKQYTGVLRSFYPKGTIKKEYHFVNGMPSGECIDFDLSGEKRTVKIF